MKIKIDKNNIAIAIAFVLHAAGCIGMLSSKAKEFVKFTPLNLLVMFGLLIWTAPKKEKSFFLFILLAFAIGFSAEVLGVHTNLLFGDYIYGNNLGPSLFGVPLILGINWFIIVYCSGVFMGKLQHRLESKIDVPGGLSPQLQLASFVVDGALLATFFDFIMEPVATELGYWQWTDNKGAHFYNYVTWFVISAALLYFMRKLRVNTSNHFAVHLLIIQILFFSILRSFL
ncbi:MAG: carotenoid biosynthesis protein [Segetibacter sp.]|nr:carotenoid biosynthesis protein [Segetibacter sp.]